MTSPKLPNQDKWILVPNPRTSSHLQRVFMELIRLLISLVVFYPLSPSYPNQRKILNLKWQSDSIMIQNSLIQIILHYQHALFLSLQYLLFCSFDCVTISLMQISFQLQDWGRDSAVLPRAWNSHGYGICLHPWRFQKWVSTDLAWLWKHNYQRERERVSLWIY